jgi:hypothetical protein
LQELSATVFKVRLGEVAPHCRVQQLTSVEQIGWEAALKEIEHQAEHWETPEHGQTGHLIASALLSAVEIARTGGVQCDHPVGGTPRG